jgi:hypothetical protein
MIIKGIGKLIISVANKTLILHTHNCCKYDMINLLNVFENGHEIDISERYSMTSMAAQASRRDLKHALCTFITHPKYMCECYIRLQSPNLKEP